MSDSKFRIKNKPLNTYGESLSLVSLNSKEMIPEKGRTVRMKDSKGQAQKLWGVPSYLRGNVTQQAW